ncbi:MAG: SAM-dependent methyltransferase [Candidatus Paracaedibacteraceae bacterium]|nr:SAM-dependent methyltransferase [Candidatus Paracaedibacteraceae bacterium]
MIEHRLKKHIETYGGITVREYQDVLLFDPTDGYYANSKVIGKSGDFITSPEISQAFGEVVALYFVNQWYQMDCPPEVLLIELGPGRGTLMLDMIRTFKQFPDFWNVVCVYLVEVCPSLMQQQIDCLGNDIKHVSSLAIVPEADVQFIVANEFFDALPVEQFVCSNANETRERVIHYSEKDGFYFEPHTDEEYIIEKSASSMIIIDEIKRRLSNGAGMALIIDYGDTHETTPDNFQRVGDTLQAVYQHQRVSVFDCMGKADLSHHVDFGTFQKALAPLRMECMTQGTFLIQNGINERTDYLAKRDNRIAAALRTGAARLTAPSAMGSLFKILIVNS